LNNQKNKKGKAYYYAVQFKRVHGKPRIVCQKYLGSVETLINRCDQSQAVLPSQTVLFEAVSVATLLGITNRIGLIDPGAALQDKCCDGDVPDLKFLPQIVRVLLIRHSPILSSLEDPTLVFDKGNLSEKRRE